MRVQELIEKLQRANDPTAVVVYDWNMMQLVVAKNIDAARAARPNTGRMCLVHSIGRMVEVQTTRPEIEVVC
jgi:hypothetical protein